MHHRLAVLAALALLLSGCASTRLHGDATLVRLVMVPAFLKLAGKWNWWLPAWLDRRLPHVTLEH